MDRIYRVYLRERKENPLLELALTYARRGWLILPVRPFWQHTTGKDLDKGQPSSKTVPAI